jgi:hypothetical protein
LTKISNDIDVELLKPETGRNTGKEGIAVDRENQEKTVFHKILIVVMALAGFGVAYGCMMFLILVLSPFLRGLHHGGGGLEIILFLIFFGLPAVNAFMWGRFQARRAPGTPIPWKPMLTVLLIIVAIPFLLFIITLIVVAFLQTAPIIKQNWRIFLSLGIAIAITGGMVFTAYKLSRRRVPSPPVPTDVEPSERREDVDEAAPRESVVFGEESDPFARGLVIMMSTASAATIAFCILAYFIFRHWAGADYGGGFISMGGIMEVMMLIGVQIVATIVSFGLTIILTARASSRHMSAAGRVANPLIFGLLAAVFNFAADAVATAAIGAYWGIY